MNSFFAIMISAILTDNFVLSKFMGICPFIGVSKKLSSSIGMGAAVIFVMTCATAFTYPAYKYMLEPLGLTYLRIILFILIIALFVQLVEIVMKKVMPPLYSSLGVYLPLITTNCAVLGVTMLNIDNGYTFWESIANAAFAGVGFTLVLVLFAGVREKMEGCDIPAALKGLPITLVAASIMALSFMGFSF